METYSERTGKTYASWGDLIASEATGYVVVSVLAKVGKKSDKLNVYPRVTGPYETRKKALSAAAYRRRCWKTRLAGNPEVTLLGVHVEPVWEHL